ncbi:type II toxin-antitoxin system Phd/YefM family antitoxin [Chloroflexi bacterium TSY]|nr:type II toxin-antitoxin system Phd/YefM family antitoxin [Chloroflexi bacterium TSY]
MIQTWQLQDAKNKFSQVIDNASSFGAQIITKRGVEVAVVLSYADYRKLKVEREKLSDFFRNSPLVGVDIDLERDTSDIRDAIAL